MEEGCQQVNQSVLGAKILVEILETLNNFANAVRGTWQKKRKERKICKVMNWPENSPGLNLITLLRYAGTYPCPSSYRTSKISSQIFVPDLREHLQKSSIV